MYALSMKSVPTIYTSDELYDKLTSILAHDDDDFTKSMARIPGLFGHSLKATFLMYRSIGFTEERSCQLIHKSRTIIKYWRETDERFTKFELEKLYELQHSFGPDMVRMGFLQNMTLMIAHDAMIINRASRDLENLTEREFTLYSKLRRTYSAAELLALEKAANPDKHPEGVIKLVWSTPEQIYQLPEPIEGELVDNVS